MDKLWAPWRVNYISAAAKSKGCLFCEASKASKDKKNLIVLRSRMVFAMLNKYPYNNGHVLIAPYRHIKDIKYFNDEETADMFHTICAVQKALNETLHPHGFNIGINIAGAAGAGMPNHLHAHIVPRWRKDTNFMPVIFNVKIISQSLEQLYGKLHKAIQRL